MKNSIVAVSIVVTLLCGFLLFEKNREVQQALARAEAAERKREMVAAEAARQESNSSRQLRQTRMSALENAAAMQQLQQQLATNRAGAAKHKDLSDLFRDEAMQEVVRSEAKAGIARNVKALFDAGLAQQLKLNDGQSAALKELLTQKSSLFLNQMLIPMMTTDLSEADMAAGGAALKQQIDANTAQIRALLGDDGYNTYQWFEKTQPERDTLNRIGPQFADAGQSLSADQMNQLQAIMTDQAANFKYQFDPSDPAQMDLQHWYDNFTDEKINTMLQDREQLNAQILDSAGGVLTPEQAALFKEFLTQQLRQAQFTSRMTSATFAKGH